MNTKGWSVVFCVLATTLFQFGFVDCYRQVRLVNGHNSYSGRVEVYQSGRWGTVCDDDFTDLEAKVVCRQLRLGGGIARIEAYFGQGSGPIWMDDLSCNGYESSLFECGYQTSHDCNHGEDAGVICGVSADANCPNGWCRHADMCYLTLGINVSWIDAKDYCTVLGGVLPKIKSETTQIAIEGVLAKTEPFIFPGKFWLDAADLQNPGEWVWMADKSSFSYTYWFPGYPSHENDTDRCLGITHADDYQWKPAPCNERRNIICQARG